MPRILTFPPGAAAAGTAFCWACAVAREPRMFVELEGEVFAGSHVHAAAWLRRIAPSARALIAIFARGDGMEALLARIPAIAPGLPIAGGAAARAAVEAIGRTGPPASEVALFAITEGVWQAAALTVHRPRGDWTTLAGTDPRRFTHTISGEPITEILARVRRDCGLAADDWDRIALTDHDGVVYHLHPEGDAIVSGADLCASREAVPAVLDATALASARSSLDGDWLVFGCAGLAGLSECRLPWDGRGAFTALFGEIHPCSGRPRFSNLTLSGLRRIS